MTDEGYPKADASETHVEELNYWSAKVKNLAVNRGKFNSDTDIYSLESHAKDGTHYILGYKPNDDGIMEPECRAISTGKNLDGTKRQHRFIWGEQEGPEVLYASQLGEIEMIIGAFEEPKEPDA